MKIYISADIEGITGVNHWDETMLGDSEHKKFAEIMTEEILAACDGIREFGQAEIYVKDAHDSGRNIDISKLPDDVKLIRGWTGDQYSMLQQLNSSFDAVLFIGYHSGAGENGNPLAHTMNHTKINYFKINGEIATEFHLHAFLAEELGVPVIFVSGDKMLCDRVNSYNSYIETVAVKEGIGNGTINISPSLSKKRIKEKVLLSMSNISLCHVEKKGSFVTEINFKTHQDARRASFYPGVKLLDEHTVSFESKSAAELMITRMFIL